MQVSAALMEGIITTAVVETIASRSLAICSIREKGPIGSGVAMLWAGRRFITTAAHVVRDMSSLGDLRFLARPGGALEIQDSPPTSVSGRRKFWFNIEITQACVSHDPDDLTCLEVHPSFIAERHNLVFYQMEDRQRTPRAGSRVVFHGYPTALLYGAEGKKVAVTNNEWGRLAAAGPRKGDYDPRYHLLIRKLPTARGQPHIETWRMSGSGVWSLAPSKRGDIWRPADVYLAGIFTGVLHENTPNELRKATKVARLRRLLASCAGE